MAHREDEILARWQARLDGVVCSPLEFFSLVRDFVEATDLSGISFSNVVKREGGWFSSKRVYLRIRYHRIFFDVSAFVAGSSLVVGWWLHRDLPGVGDLLAEIPGLRFVLERTSRAATYYTVDIIEHFQRSVHESVLAIVDKLSEGKSAAFLNEAEKQPVWEIW
jgi:hypothetical protein